MNYGTFYQCLEVLLHNFGGRRYLITNSDVYESVFTTCNLTHVLKAPDASGSTLRSRSGPVNKGPTVIYTASNTTVDHDSFHNLLLDWLRLKLGMDLSEGC